MLASATKLEAGFGLPPFFYIYIRFHYLYNASFLAIPPRSLRLGRQASQSPTAAARSTPPLAGIVRRVLPASQAALTSSFAQPGAACAQHNGGTL